MPTLLLDVAWRITGPFLTAGGDIVVDVDRAFYRSAGGFLAVPRPHVKGKLREAASFLAAACRTGSNGEIDWWFGKAEVEGYEPERLFVSDLRPLPDEEIGQPWRPDLERGTVDDELPSDTESRETFAKFLLAAGPHTVKEADRARRTAIGPHRRALDHTLRTEEIQPRGLPLWWAGQIEVVDPDYDRLKALAAFLSEAAGAITHFGGDYTSGYGIVRSARFRAKIVETCKPAPERESTGEVKSSAAHPNTPSRIAGRHNSDKRRRFDLALFPIEPIFIAGTKLPGSNFVEGLRYIPGSAIKGAVAARMNLEVGSSLRKPIGERRCKLMERWPNLTRYFTSVRFLHALPARQENGTLARSFRIPFSAFATDKTGSEVFDAAVGGLPKDTVPHFAPDCDPLEGWAFDSGGAGAALDAAEVDVSTVFRTQINAERLRAEDEHLFGYEEIAPIGRDGRPQAFATAVVIPDDGNGLADEICCELASILPWIRLGKTSAAVRVRRVGNRAQQPSLEERLEAYGKRPIVLTLATDALLPVDVSNITSSTNLRDLYDKAWKEVLNTLGYRCAEESFIEDVFARQELRGGWAGHLGRKRNKYRTFFLTRAGSVFVTTVSATSCPSDLQTALATLEERGVPLADNDLNWSNCLFVPENGYGEVLVCSPWHIMRGAGQEDARRAA